MNIKTLNYKLSILLLCTFILFLGFSFVDFTYAQQDLPACPDGSLPVGDPPSCLGGETVESNSAEGRTFKEIIEDINSVILSPLIGLLMTLAVVVFLWGLVTYIFSAGNENSKDKGKRIMIGGVIALFVMVSVWGIVIFFADFLFGGIPSSPPDLPLL